MDNDPEPHPVADTLDRVLKKYGKIWIWSILLTLGAAEFLRSMGNLSMVALNVRMFPGAGSDSGGLVLAIAGVIECIAGLLSLFWLFQFMLREVLPIFFQDDEQGRTSDGARLLYRAFGATLIGVGVQIGSYILIVIWKLRG